ncbi:peptidase family S41 [Kordia sp. SMS9]|uniref:S41 family peptidase n=1 Tax=Kordia sp. SMS9 TaxID=2282170 RepID=UPI000E0D9DB0|nr:S41 family peptidase [Kordia sp. SMS9]AXG68940.1 peptidase family S41 [Kordia sp. SMS9]
MKKTILFLVCSLFIINANAQSVDEQTKIKEFGLIWGFLKYHHPIHSAGKTDIDAEFLHHFQQLKNIQERSALNTFFFDWIRSYGEVSDKIKTPSEDYNFTKNLNLDWMQNEAFSTELRQLLSTVRSNTKNYKGHYAQLEKLTRFVSFNKEKKLKNFSPENKAHRMLTLFRFWNVINYYDVNKYLAKENWNTVLENAITPFINAYDAKTYDKAKTELISKLNDAHAFYIGEAYGLPKFKYKTPFQTKYINDTLVVTKLWNKELCQKNGIELGGMITKIEDKTVKEYIKENFKTIYNYANENTLMYRAERVALYQENREEVNISYTKPNGTESASKTIQLFDRMNVDAEKESLKKSPYYGQKFYEITPTTAYINLGFLEKKDLNKILKKASNYKAVIFDLRMYPKYVDLPKLTKWLYPNRSKFIKVLFPTKVPGLGEYDAEAPLNFVSDPFSGGRKNKNYYKGKVFLLVNASTVSQAEYISMAIQNSPNCTTIGEETMGAVMNITSIPMPEGQEVNFTSVGAFYPDGTGVQNKGLQLDYKITQRASQPERDMMVEKVLELLE